MSSPTSTYRDVSLTFKPHPGSNDVLKLTDLDAVRASIVTLLFSSPLDSPVDPTFGGNVRGMLFENSTPTTIAIAKRQITLILAEYEPRVIIQELYIGNSQEQSNVLDIGILYYVVGNPLQQVINYTLNRIR